MATLRTKLDKKHMLYVLEELAKYADNMVSKSRLPESKAYFQGQADAYKYAKKVLNNEI